MEREYSRSTGSSTSGIVVAADFGATVRLAAFAEVGGKLRLLGVGEGPATHGAPEFDPEVGLEAARAALNAQLGVYAGPTLPAPAAITGSAIGCAVPAALISNLPVKEEARLEELLLAQGFAVAVKFSAPKRRLKDKFSPAELARQLVETQASLVVVALAGDQRWESLATAVDILRFGLRGRVAGYRPAVALLHGEIPEAALLAELASAFKVFQVSIRNSARGLDPALARALLGSVYQSLLIETAWSRTPRGLAAARAIPLDAAIASVARAIAERERLAVAVLHSEPSGAVAAYSDAAGARVSSFGFRREMATIEHVGLQLPIDEILQWVPSSISQTEAIAHFTNRAWRPWLVPETQTELLLDHAAAHLALREAVRLLADPSPPADMIICTGRLLSRAPRPMQAALCALNAYLPWGYSQVALDRTGALSFYGALLAMGQECFPEESLLHVCTAVACSGIEKPGALAAAVEVDAGGGEPISRQVAFGAMDKIMWHSSAPATVRVWPGGKLDVGGGRGRATSLRVKVKAGTAGVIVDARGRPLEWPKDPAHRRAAVLQWFQSTDSYLLPAPELEGVAVEF